MWVRGQVLWGAVGGVWQEEEEEEEEEVVVVVVVGRKVGLGWQVCRHRWSRNCRRWEVLGGRRRRRLPRRGWTCQVRVGGGGVGAWVWGVWGCGNIVPQG